MSTVVRGRGVVIGRFVPHFHFLPFSKSRVHFLTPFPPVLPLLPFQVGRGSFFSNLSPPRDFSFFRVRVGAPLGGRIQNLGSVWQYPELNITDESRPYARRVSVEELEGRVLRRLFRHFSAPGPKDGSARDPLPSSRPCPLAPSARRQ